MDMSADLLSCLGCPEHPNYRNLRIFVYLRKVGVVWERRIKFGRGRLVGIYIVQSDTEKVHIESMSVWRTENETEHA